MSEDALLAPVVIDYDPAWLTEGLALADEMHAALAPLALCVEHIGSTAIPGMASKPIFDLQASVNDLWEAEQVFDQPLAALGFQRSAYQHDHVPAGRADAPEHWTKRLWLRRGYAAMDVHLHVRVLGAPNERLALLFRDWFRAHPEAIPAYARFKRVLAGTVSNTGTYADVKDPIVDLIITIAESWATATGWSPHTATTSPRAGQQSIRRRADDRSPCSTPSDEPDGVARLHCSLPWSLTRRALRSARAGLTLVPRQTTET